MNSKFGFKSAEHFENTKAKRIREKNKKQPVKLFSREEISALANLMGLQVSNNFKPTLPKHTSCIKEVDIVVSDLPENLRKYL